VLLTSHLVSRGDREECSRAATHRASPLALPSHLPPRHQVGCAAGVSELWTGLEEVAEAAAAAAAAAAGAAAAEGNAAELAERLRESKVRACRPRRARAAALLSSCPISSYLVFSRWET
jgi:hypothetical protein